MLHTLRNALPIVAAALGRKFSVEVGVGGHDACTDGRRIRIPDVQDDPASRDLAWGYLAHEAAHVRYTDFAVYELAAREGPLQEMLQNRIEDVRIERELARPYPGTRTTIVKVLRRMLAEGRMSAPQPTDHPAQVLAAYLLLTLRHEVLNQRVLAEEAGKAAAILRQVFPAPFLARLRSLMDEVPGLTSTAETVDLARRIRRLIEDQADPLSGNGSGDPGDTNGEDETDQTSGAAGSLDDDEPPRMKKAVNLNRTARKQERMEYRTAWSQRRTERRTVVRTDPNPSRITATRRSRPMRPTGTRTLRELPGQMLAVAIRKMPWPRCWRQAQATATTTCSPRSGSCSVQRHPRPTRFDCLYPRITRAMPLRACVCWPKCKRNRRD